MDERSIRIWSVVDANGNALYSSNVLEDVKAHLEQRIAREPRLRRVLRIAEQTLTFQARDEPEGDPGEPQTICVLPWLPLDDPVRMGSLVFDHWSEIRERVPEPARASADQLLAHFYDVYGQQLDPVVCFFADRSPAARLDAAETEFVRAHTFLLALAGLAESTYMHPAFEPFNAAHARRIFVNFNAAKPEIHTVHRRREGWAQSRWSRQELKLIKPFAAEGRPTAAGEHPLMTLYRQQFVDSLARCVAADDSLSSAICQSVIPFLRANDMDEYGSVEQDIVWLVAAFEQLLGVAFQREAGRRGSELHMQVGQLFSEQWRPDEVRTCRRWLEHLRKKRNELHGHPATVSGWQPWAHALLGAALFPLTVKTLLSHQERYVLDSIDLMKIEAFPAQVRLVAGDGPFNEERLGEAWHQAVVDAAGRRVARNATSDSDAD